MTIQSKFYPVNQLDQRKTNRFIVLSHVSNFVLKTHAFPPDLRNKTNYHCLPDLREYYREKVEMRQMPFHYHVCRLKGEWEAFGTAPEHYRSPIIDKAAENYYIEDKFKDAIIICVQDNFALNTPDERMHQLISSTLIAPMLKQFRVNFRDSVFWWDEIFNWDKYQYDRKNNPLDWSYPWEVNRMLYFDRVIFNLESIKYF
jgi:hypothetical protein